MGNARFAASLALVIGLSAGCTADPTKPTTADPVSSVDPALAELNEWDDYVMSDLGDFGGTYNIAVDINDAGQIAGVSAPTPADYAGRRAWVSDGTTLTMLPLLLATLSSDARAINAAGDIVGGNGQNVIWSAGGVQGLRNAYPSLAVVRDINDAGVMAGDCSVPRSSYWFACILDHGKTTVMDTTGYRSSTVAAINGHGMVVGSRRGPQEYSAYSWSGSAAANTLPVLGNPTYPYASAADINDAGDIVGRSMMFDSWRATLWRQGVATDLGAMHGYISWAGRINDRMEVIGQTVPIFDGTPGNARPFLWRNGRMRLLPTGNLRLESGEPRAINNRGDIVGSITLPNNETRAVIWRKR